MINFKVPPSTAESLPRVASEKSDSSRTRFYSHDWTDPCTWLETASRVVDEVATDSGDKTTYNLSNNNVIDTFHGKITGEDFLTDSGENSYRVIVKVDEVVKDEVDPHTSTGDYTVDHENGDIVFEIALTGTPVVKVTYHYANGSSFTVKPGAGKILRIEMVEVQFSADVVLNDSVVFQPRGYVDVFAPHLLTTANPPGPYPPGTLIPLGNPLIYKTMRDYMNDAFRAYPSYIPMGGAGWRGLSQAAMVFDWDYVAATRLSSAAGMEILVCLEHDVAIGGEYATATFYCTTENEA